MTLYWLAGVIALACALLAAIRLLRGSGEERIASPEEAADAADTALPGFATEGAVVGADGGGALAVDARGRVAAMKRRRGDIAVREVAWQSLRATPEGIVIDTGDRRIGSVALHGVDVLDIRRLAPAHAKSLASSPSRR